jgi:trehalose 6-phosphate synthase
MADDRIPHWGDGSLADTVLVSNRGPLAFHLEDGVPVAGTSAGGLAESMRPLVVGSEATWVASALGEADRAAAAAGMMSDEGIHIELVEPEPEIYNLAYNVVSNAMLWFCHHHLFDAARRPRADQRWLEAWEAYREFNQLFAQRVAKVAPEGGRVLVQDYHLALMGSDLARLRPDLRTTHFSHTPFADPSVLRMLPTAVGNELLASMAGFGACGFHTERWASAYRANQAMVGRRPGEGAAPERSESDDRHRPTFVSPLSTDPERLRASAQEPAVGRALARIEEKIGGSDRQVIVRVDRMELSKNLLRGFWAFDELLEIQPHRRQRVVFVALAYPTRQGLPEYLAYQNEVESTVERINHQWGTPDWTPIVLEVEDDYPRSLAALTRYDVLLVNPVRDGLNLVAKEGPLVNTRDGVLALSREAGAFDELAPAVLEVNPFDVSGTAAVLAEALDMDPERRAASAERLRRLILARHPAHWLQAQLDMARRSHDPISE